jgi:signal transduction histidine kinase
MFDLPRPLQRWSLLVTGVVLATVPAMRLPATPTPVTTLLEGVVPLLLLAGVIYAGWAYAHRESPTFTAIVTAWTLSVVAGMVVVALWIGTLAHLAEGDASVRTLSPIVMSVGAVVGLWLGTSNARWRERETALRRERQRIDFLNELLRHYVLNAAQVIVGRADLLAARTDDDAAADISRTGRRMARHVQQMRALVRSDDGCWPVDLRSAVEAARDSLDDRDDVTIAAEMPDPCPVVADDALDVLIEALCFQAVDRADGAPLTIRLVASRERGGVSLTVHDDADGPDVETVDPETIDENSGVHEFQWYLVGTLIERYGGSVSVTGDGVDARVEVWLPAPEDAFGNA